VAVHIVVDKHVFLAGIVPVEPSGILLHSPFPGNAPVRFAIVSFSVAAIGNSHHIGRPLRVLRPRDIDNYNMVSIHILDEHILGGNHIHTSLVGIIHDIPKSLYPNRTT